MVRLVTEGRLADQLDVDMITPVLDPVDMISLQDAVARITVDDSVLDYAIRLTRATREAAGFERGAGPRASIALVRAARACALLSGRDFVVPEDVKRIALPVLRHRVRIAADLEIEGAHADTVLGRLLDDVEAPRA